MSQATAYSPSHVTGFFEILDQSDEISERGSRGSGISLSKGVTTEVSVRRTSGQRIMISINNELTHNAKVSETVARDYLDRAEGRYSVEIKHHFEVPIGTGFGTSGAGALSLSLALNKALELGLSTVEASQIAHQAEIEIKTGLGTVIAETYGGVEIRLKPGAPGVGRIMEIPYGNDMEVYAVGFGPISTTHVLSTPWMRDRINGHASRLLWSLLEKPSTSNLMQLSREFSDGIGLTTPRVRSLLSLFDQLNIQASMLMMGEGTFCILSHEDAERTKVLLKQKLPSAVYSFSSSIASSGARLLDA